MNTLPTLVHLLLFAAGAVAGAVNVLAGGGSFLTLPVLIFAGLPASVANGTNRLAILTQNVGAVWSFDRSRLLPRRWAAWTALPAIAGAVVGTWGALVVSDRAFTRLLAVAMVGVTLWTLLRPVRPGASAAPLPARPTLPLALGFFLAGLYGGFVQAGVGFFILALTTAGGLDLIRGNAVKVLVILLFTVLSLALFVANGRVDWIAGASLAAGSLTGGLVGARLTRLRGERWVRHFVVATVLIFAAKLLLAP